MNTIKIEGTLKSINGKKASADARVNDLVPCNLYGGKENVIFTASAKSVRTLVFTPEFQIAEITVGGNTIKAILKEVQTDPLSDEITHIDFLTIEDGKKISIEMPLKLIGTPKGVRDGGKLNQKMRKLKIKTTPDKIVSMLEVNVEHMELGSTLRISDINIPGIEVMHSSSIPVASVFVPRVIKDETPAAAAAAPVAAAAAPAAAAAKPAAKAADKKK